jgi:hypothetical protein
MAEEQEWANLLAEIFDKLTQKHASITYDFENLEILIFPPIFYLSYKEVD